MFVTLFFWKIKNYEIFFLELVFELDHFFPIMFNFFPLPSWFVSCIWIWSYIW
jgi:hypothetical protein